MGRVTLQLPVNAEVDRVVIEEDLSKGERVNAYAISVDGTQVANGQSVGHKRIALLDKPRTGHTLVVNASGADNAKLKRVSAFKCARTPNPEACSFIKDFQYKIVDDITISQHTHSSPEACCAACRASTQCAVFVLDGKETCTLLSANQGGGTAVGTVSGSPTSAAILV